MERTRIPARSSGMMVSWDDAFHCVEALTFIRGSGAARLVSTVQLSLVSLKQCGYLHAGGVAAASFSLVEPHPTDESAFCDSMGSATVSRLGGLALPHLDLTDLFVSL